MAVSTIVQGTEPSLELSMPRGINVTQVSELIINLTQGDFVIEKTTRDVQIDYNCNRVFVPLTANETLSFSAGVINVQMLYRLGCDNNLRGTFLSPIKIYPKGSSIRTSYNTSYNPNIVNTGCSCNNQENYNMGVGAVASSHYISQNDYNLLKNTPIVNIQGISPMGYVNLSGLLAGHYMLKGFYRLVLGSELKNSPDSLEVRVFDGFEAGEGSARIKVITFDVLENGELVHHKYTFKNSVLIEVAETFVDGSKWEDWD